MRKLLVIFLMVALAFPVVVHAQGTVRFGGVEIEIWPEYDRPDALVIMRLTLAEDVNLPVDLAIRIPVESEINAVAIQDASGTLITTDYTPRNEGEWTIISITTESPQVQIEYYDPLLKQGSTRTYEYIWSGVYAVDSFLFKLPIDATGLQSEPALALIGVGEDGLSYYGLDRGVIPAGYDFFLHLSYEKTTERLSTTGQPVEPVEDLGSGIANLNLNQYIPWGIGGLGFILIIVGIVYFVSHRRAGSSGKVKRKRHSTTGTGSGGDGATYCHECGRRAQPSDRFCRACGTRLRREE
jgi:hypothetical protein